MKINVNKEAQRIEVDNQIPLRKYYRIADTLLKQANVYRNEKNVVDLFIMLLRFSSLISETIPRHRDYQVLFSKEKSFYKKKLLSVVDELEALKPEFDRQVNELERVHRQSQLPQLERQERIGYSAETSSLERPSVNKNYSPILDVKQPASLQPRSSWSYNDFHSQSSSSNAVQAGKQFQKRSLNLPLPNPETMSRHSILGHNGLQGKWRGPSTDKIQYPRSQDLLTGNLRVNQDVRYDLVAHKDDDLGETSLMMESVLSLDDSRWRHSAEESCSPLITELKEDPFQSLNIRQPSPPPVLAQVHQGFAPIPPSKVADPRPGLPNSSQDGTNSYQHLHIPVQMLEEFLRLAQANTKRNLETCGVLAGSLKNRIFHITTLIIPKQESTSDSCQTLNEEEIFEAQDKLSLFPLGWIHTHPSQTCFMSSVDLHTHYSYQIMLPEAIAIVMAPTDTSSPHGIFHLSDPAGVSVIRNCQQRGFHPHEEPLDGSPIYEHCSHVYMNSKLKFDVMDLR